MRRYFVGLISLAMLIAGLLLVLHPGSSTARSKRWTQTDPPINFAHVFHGEINRRGKPVGFHSRPEGKDPRHARLVKRLDGPNQEGVYVARVAIREPGSEKWLEKNSSVFPDSMSPQDVIQVILHAFRKGKTDDRGKFRGPSGRGFTIEGWTLRDGKINTAYPIYRAQRRR
ncbi:MAG: EndoU domain-containing protein [Candidatus Tectomicrobia bacterium]|nr:EndoU domain-containing protein [Candidatus Tectomicrobia bacterium]